MLAPLESTQSSPEREQRRGNRAGLVSAARPKTALSTCRLPGHGPMADGAVSCATGAVHSSTTAVRPSSQGAPIEMTRALEDSSEQTCTLVQSPAHPAGITSPLPMRTTRLGVIVLLPLRPTLSCAIHSKEGRGAREGRSRQHEPSTV